jgi:hypothetical protein
MKRYNNIPQLDRWDGKKVLKTTHYPEIVQSDNDLFIVTNETDYLDTLAFKYYSDPTLWWIIALANNIGKGRMSVEEGLQLRIPSNVSKIISDFNTMNT